MINYSVVVATRTRNRKGPGYKGEHNGVFVGGDRIALHCDCGRGYTNLHM